MAKAALNLNTSLFKAGDRIAVAVSGGADSVSLLLALHEQRHQLGLGPTAIHVDHNLRGEEGKADAEFVRELCERLDVPLTIAEVDVPARIEATKETLEEAARNLRYEVFEKLEVDAVATAHTLDDQAETVLMKLLRGAWTDGLAGISPVVAELPRIVRPLLGTTRAEVEEFLTARRQTWRTDSSNASLDMTRNRVRHELLPSLKVFNPQLVPALAQIAELAREEESHWQTEVKRLLPSLVLPGTPVRGGGRSTSTSPAEQSIAIEIERLKSLNLATRRRILRAAARQHLGCRLSFSETAKILAMCGLAGESWTPDPTVSTKPGASLHLSGGLKAKRTAREIQLSRS